MTEDLVEPIAAAGWRAPLWLNIEWRFTVLLVLTLLVSLLTKIPLYIITVVVVDLGLYLYVFTPISEREPFILDLWANCRRFSKVLVRLADATDPQPNLPARQRT